MFDELWSEIQDMPGEIFDIEDFKVDVKMPCEIALESDKEIMAIHNQLDQWHKGGCIAPHLLYCIEVNQTTPNMRKIEEQMCNAVHHNIDWKNSNTSVTYCEESGESKVYLHGNHIATVGDDFLQIFDGGWQSNTTKSRLNSLINRFCNAMTDGVYQHKFEWFIRDNNVTREFENGYIFA